MPTYLLIGIPIVVGILLYAILSLPDEEINPTEVSSKKILEKKAKKKKGR